MSEQILSQDVAATKKEITAAPKRKSLSTGPGYAMDSLVFSLRHGPAYYRGAHRRVPGAPVEGYYVEPLFGFEANSRIRIMPDMLRRVNHGAELERALERLLDAKPAPTEKAQRVFAKGDLLKLVNVVKGIWPTLKTRRSDNFDRALFLVAGEFTAHVMRHKDIEGGAQDYFENTQALLKLILAGGAKTVKLHDFSDPASSKREKFAVGYVKPVPTVKVRPLRSERQPRPAKLPKPEVAKTPSPFFVPTTRLIRRADLQPQSAVEPEILDLSKYTLESVFGPTEKPAHATEEYTLTSVFGTVACRAVPEPNPVEDWERKLRAKWKPRAPVAS